MENIRLALIRIILASIILNLITLTEAKKVGKDLHILSSSSKNEDVKLHGYLKSDKNYHKHLKKAKRSAYDRSWSSKAYNNGMNYMPPYLVFNRKMGAYYPYYTQQKENNVRRNMMRKSSNNNRY